MKMIRLYSGDDGQSHFEEVDIALAPTEMPDLSKPFPVEHMQFGSLEGVDEIPWHNMDAPHFVIILQGEMELEVGDGTRQPIKAGDILLAEDMTGQGHKTHAVDGKPWTFLMAPVRQ